MASRTLIFLIISFLALAIMGAGIFIPVLPAMVKAFNSEAKTLTATLSLLGLGSWLASPFYGPIADSYGRRVTVLIALLLFIGSTLLCAIAPSITVLFIGCFLLGVACTGLQIIGIAVLGDLYKGNNYTRMSAFTGAIITLSVSASPLLGGIIGAQWEWRGIFYFLALASLILIRVVWQYFPETAPQLLAHPFKGNLTLYRRMLTHKGFLIAALLSALIASLNIAYTSMTSYFYAHEHSLSSAYIGILHAIGPLANAMTCFTVIPLTKKWSNLQLLKHGIGWVVACGFIFFGLGFVKLTPLLLLVPYILFNIALGFTIAPLTVIAVECFPDAKGTASAIIIAIRSLVSSVIAYLAGALYDGTPFTMALFFACLIFFTIMLYVMADNGTPTALRKQKKVINFVD